MTINLHISIVNQKHIKNVNSTRGREMWENNSIPFRVYTLI